MDFPFSDFTQFQDIKMSIILLALTLWSFTIKGFALWYAARDLQKNWFIAILVLNTMGIIELIYFFKFAKKNYAYIIFTQKWGKIKANFSRR